VAGFSGFVLNTNGAGPGPSVASDVLTLTHADTNLEANSAIFGTKQDVSGGFVVQFTYLEVPGDQRPGLEPADGVTFIMENDPRGTGAVGGPGGSLGNGATTPITPSAAVEFNIYISNGVGTSYNTNGSNGPYSSTSPVNLASGDSIGVTLTYDGTTLEEHLVDGGSTFDTSYTVNLGTDAGGSLAYIGFTGADGSSTSTQTISDFSFTSTAVPIPRAAWTGLGLLGLLGAFGLKRQALKA
jgi:hypothetical protein